ncbi:aminoglycoside phosphotransferase family protein [Conexibacter stalactiti]|uniref:Aminoglycoside phosphotransferase family protein n=1 Tax=Conexibacter stalactiti TaxID=1940611 RepID=A0ABU4HJ59_9ACTN|nr:aminoglycoside phosphotransferase family protein [Conexibacter stalactiti]MDW5593336.1 aminoglycoside phosphotransferase family protein [Conexibacter stalactiti]MEC5033977.1 aminoglycoside phosphotransferase family protein [Conexibacter stalactiti]
MDASEQIERRLSELRIRWGGFWPDDDLSAIAADVRRRIGRARDGWALSELEPLPDGHVAFAARTERDGEAVVLKVNPREHPDARDLLAEGQALRFWEPTGAAARLLDERDDGFTLLLEELRPGTPLDAAGLSWEERLTTIGRLVARLHRAGTPPAALPRLGAGYADGWRSALADDRPALAELELLLRPDADDLLLHADLHGGNALRAGDEWRAIDPHALRGDRHADVWALIDPLAPALPDAPRAAAEEARRWLELYAAAAELEPERAAAWTCLRARAEALAIDRDGFTASDEDRAWATRLHRIANALA